MNIQPAVQLLLCPSQLPRIEEAAPKVGHGTTMPSLPRTCFFIQPPEPLRLAEEGAPVDRMLLEQDLSRTLSCPQHAPATAHST